MLNMSLTANETLESQIDGASPSDPISEFPSTEPLGASQPAPNQSSDAGLSREGVERRIHGDELSEVIRRACIKVEIQLAGQAKWTQLPKGNSSRKMIKAFIQAVVETMPYLSEIQAEVVKKLGLARVEEYAKSPNNCFLAHVAAVHIFTLCGPHFK
jgi:hypothetical protein